MDSGIQILSNRQCGLPQNCLTHGHVIDRVDDPDLSLIQLVQCMLAHKMNPNIMAVQLDCIFYLTSILKHSRQPSITSKNEQLDRLLTEYCTTYHQVIYNDFVKDWDTPQVRSLYPILASNYDPIVKYFYQVLSKNKETYHYFHRLSTDYKAKILEIFHVISLLGPYVHQLSGYYSNNYSIVDFINDVMIFEENQFRKKKRQTSEKHQVPSIFNVKYQPGCNCLCRTILLGTMLKILADQKHLSYIKSSDIQWALSAEESQCHIYLAIQLGPNKLNPEDYWYIESTETVTYNLSTILSSILQNLDKHIVHTIEHYERKGNYYISDVDPFLLVINNHLLRHPQSIALWQQHEPKLLEHQVFNKIMIVSPSTSMTEKFGRIYEELSVYYQSQLIWHYMCSILSHMMPIDWDHPIKYVLDFPIYPELLQIAQEIVHNRQYKGKDFHQIFDNYRNLHKNPQIGYFYNNCFEKFSKIYDLLGYYVHLYRGRNSEMVTLIDNS